MAPSGELNHLTGIALLLGIQTGLQRGDLPRTLEGVRPAAFLDGTAIRLMPTHGRVPANRAWAGRHPWADARPSSVKYVYARFTACMGCRRRFPVIAGSRCS